MTAQKCKRAPRPDHVAGFGSADDPAMQDADKPMYPGTPIQKVEDKHHQDAAPADEDDEDDGK